MDGLLLAVCNNKVIGQLGLIPVKLKYGNEIHDAQWACDLVVDSEFRRHKIATKLFSEGFQRDAITLGNNPSPAADVMMRSIGFKPIRSGRKMTLPIKTEALVRIATPKRLKFTVPLLNRFVQPYFTRKVQKINKEKNIFKAIERENIISFIETRQREINKPQVLHDADFINWRIKGTEGFAKQLDTSVLPDGSYSIHSDFKPSYFIYDWYCKSFEETRQLISFVMNKALSSESSTIQVIANDTNEENSLSKLGFIRSRNIEKIIYFSKNNILNGAESFHFTLYDADINL